MLRYTRTLVAALTVGLVLAVAAHAYAGSATRYMADDYGHAASVQARGWLGAQRARYLGWTGRFSASLTESTAARLGPHVAPYLPPLALALWLAALTVAALQLRLAPSLPGPLVAVLFGSLVLFLTIEGTPLVAQSLYWLAGMHTYVPPLILASLYAGLLSRRLRRPDRPRPAGLWLVAGAALTFTAGGFSEMFATLQVGALCVALAATALVGSPRLRRAASPLLVAGLGGSLLAAVIVAVAPGNRVRQSYFPPPPDPLTLLRLTLDHTKQFLLESSGRTPLRFLGALAVSGLFGAGLLSGDRPPPGSWRRMVRPFLWIPIVTVALVATCFAASTYGLSSPPPQRSLIIPQFVLSCGLVAWGCYAGGLAQQARLGPALGREGLLWQVVLSGMVALLAANALLAAWRTAQSRARFAVYASAWDATDRLIRTAKARGATRVSVPPFPNPAGLEDPGADPNHWVNQGISSYYGLTVLAHPALPTPTATEWERMVPLDARIGDVAQILGYELEDTSAHPGQTLAVNVYWRPQAATERPYTVFVHLYGADPQPVAQWDGYPGEGEYPTTVWVYGQPFVDTYPLTIPEGLGATRLDVVLGLYDLETAQRLPTSGRDADARSSSVRLGEIEVRP